MLPIRAARWLSVVGFIFFALCASGCLPSSSDSDEETTEIAPERRFVNTAISTSGNGSSWAQAFATVDEALTAAASDAVITEIWVAQGTYYPADTAGIASSLQLQPGVTLFGGFRSGHTRQSQRAPSTYPTILNGAIGGGTPSEYVRHVVSGADSAVLDGFTITNGHARDSDWFSMSGGGLRVDSVTMTVRNCTFTNNVADADGGGILVVDGNLNVSNCSFVSNSAIKGGGLQAVRSTVRIATSQFTTNTGIGTTSLGGGLSSYQSTMWIERSTFIDNTTAEHGGGVWIDASNLFLVASVFRGNSARWGGGASVYQSQADIANCVFAANWGYIPSGSSNDCGGGAINSNSNGDGQFRVVNCTFVDNYALEGSVGGIGGASIANNTKDTYQNCVFWGNHVSVSGTFGHTLRIVSNALISLGYSLFEGTFANPWIHSTTYLVDLGSNVTGSTEVGFIDETDADGADDEWGTEDDGLHLISTSPAAQSGLIAALDDLATSPERVTALATDIVGTPRTTTGTICMGAYEMVMPVGGG